MTLKQHERATAIAGTGEKQLAGIFGFEGVGDGYLKSSQKDKAIRAYQRLLELDPNNNGALPETRPSASELSA